MDNVLVKDYCYKSNNCSCPILHGNIPSEDAYICYYNIVYYLKNKKFEDSYIEYINNL